MNTLKRNFEPSDFGHNSWNFVKNTITESNVKKFLFQYPIVYLRKAYRLRYGKPAPLEATMINLFHGRKYPNVILPINERIVFGRPKNVTNFTGRIQIKGTCWFQAIMNGWLLSRVGRKVIRERLLAFKKSSNVRKLTKNQLFAACPSRKHVPQSYFWSYVEHMLEPKEWNTAFRVNVMRGIEFPEENLIRSSGLRNNKENIVGGSLRDVRAFNNIIFKGEQYHFVTSQLFENSSLRIPEILAPGWKLSHAYIVCGSHAIAGYIGLNGNPMIFDSNNPRPQFLDWVKRPKNVIEYFTSRYKVPVKTFAIVATYLHHYKPSNAPSPETRKFNKSKFNIRRTNRYTKNNYVRFFKNMYTKENFNNRPMNTNNLGKLMAYVIMSNSGNNRPTLRRRYRLKFGKHAPGNMSNKNILLALNGVKNKTNNN